MTIAAVRGPGFDTRSGNILSFLLPLFQGGQLSVTDESVHEVLVNRLGGLSLPRKSVVTLTDRPDMTLDVYHGRKTTIQQIVQFHIYMADFTRDMYMYRRQGCINRICV